jgi:uncharacterized protein YjbI with pentapeptide repeats
VIGSDVFGNIEDASYDLSRSNLTMASIEGNFTGTILEDCTLGAAIFSEATMAGVLLARSRARAARFWKTSFEHSEMDDIVIESSIFEHCNMQSSQACRTKATKTIFANCIQRYCHYPQCRFNHVKWINGSCSWTSFKESQFDDAEITDIDAEYTSFVKCQFFSVVFLRSNLKQANFTGSSFYKVGFFGCDLSQSEGLTNEMLQNTFGDVSTLLPAGLMRPEHWSPVEIRPEDIWRTMNPEMAAALARIQ